MGHSFSKDMSSVLPAQMWQEVALSGLDAIDICRVGQTCKSLYRISHDPQLWKNMWKMKHGSALPPLSNGQADPCKGVSEIIGSSEVDCLAERYHWRHQYLSRDVFYKRMLDDRDMEQCVWAGTNDDKLVSGMACVIHGQIWIRLHRDLNKNKPTYNVKLRVVTYFGKRSEDPKDTKIQKHITMEIPSSCIRWPKKFKGEASSMHIPYGKTWRFPFTYHMTPQHMYDTWYEGTKRTFDRYSICHLDVIVTSVEDKSCFLMSTTRLHVNRPTHDPLSLLPRKSRTRKYRSQGDMHFIVGLEHTHFQPGEAIIVEILIINDGPIKDESDARSLESILLDLWEVTIYEIVRSPGRPVTNRRIMTGRNKMEGRLLRFSRALWSGFTIPLDIKPGPHSTYQVEARALKYQMPTIPVAFQIVYPVEGPIVPVQTADQNVG